MKNKGNNKNYLPKWVVKKMIEKAVYNAYKEGIKDATYQIKEALGKDRYHI